MSQSIKSPQKLGMIVRMDRTGLGYQTRNLARMLNPDRLLVIDSTGFNKNQQFPNWYEGKTGMIVKGFPKNRDIVTFSRGLDAILTCETAYNNYLYTLAKSRGIRTYCQPNHEFGDHLVSKITLPTKFFMPSFWHLEEWQERFGNVVYLPPPTDDGDFAEARRLNMERKGKVRFVHIVGRQAVHDRNGTDDIIEALKHCKEDFELEIRSQKPLDRDTASLSDERLTFDISDHSEQDSLYKDADVLLMPRRYGGLCLPMNEALMSGLPVVMTDISPNNRALPSEWLVPATQRTSFMARTMVEVYQTDPLELAKKIDEFAKKKRSGILKEQNKAYDIAKKQYSFWALKQKYIQEMELEDAT